ncbi:MAG: GDP-L-fucose synthase [Desulfobacterales bacterium]|nr:GDP-L-fucose synthase [Desulfobacterales bacterium]MBF0396171.1 GDP-L-fucose synthase [Desulfobacterales bacterium]
MDKKSKIFVSGGYKMIGAEILKVLEQKGYLNIVGRGDEEPDLLDQKAVKDFFNKTKPDYVIIAGGKSGGIAANQKYPADFMIDNLLSECFIIHEAYKNGVKKLLYLASSCSYPKLSAQPMKEEFLLTGHLESTNESYAVAKIAGIKLCQAYRKQYDMNFISAIPANVFGPGDDFSIEDSHVIGALITKIHNAIKNKEEKLIIWGTGKPRRDFIYVNDLANASIFLLDHYNNIEPINIGSNNDLSISDLAGIIKEITGYSGELIFDTSKPDGMPLKILDTQKINQMGWKPSWNMQDALKQTYQWFTHNICSSKIQE